VGKSRQVGKSIQVEASSVLIYPVNFNLRQSLVSRTLIHFLILHPTFDGPQRHPLFSQLCRFVVMLQVAVIVRYSLSPFRGLARRFGQQPVHSVIHHLLECSIVVFCAFTFSWGASMGVLWGLIASVLCRIAHYSCAVHIVFFPFPVLVPGLRSLLGRSFRWA
jgi:hypothetical protein